MNPTSHVTPGHLLERLLKTRFFQGRFNVRDPLRVGICVSGGPDSMALAYLIQNMPHPHNEGIKAFSPHAFVIDHGARDGSHEEAMWVKDQLERLNMKTVVRRINWSPSVDPASIPGFEMAARQERYHALGRLAYKYRVSALFAGHHEDDQVETMITRLMRDQTLNPFSFRGIETTTNLPCNADYFYVTPNSSPLFPQSSQGSKVPTSTGLTDQLQPEKYFGGVRLHRPLLSYKKSDLVATCDYFMVPYVQDKTNFDPQLTVRNAVRHLRTNHNLPKALQGTSLLNLRTKAITIINDIAEQARKFQDSYVLGLRMRSETGVILLRLRPLPPSMDQGQLRAFSYFIQRILNLVSPLDRNRKNSMLEQRHTEDLRSLISGSKSTNSILIDKVVCNRKLSTSSFSPSRDVLLTFSRQPFTQMEKDKQTTPFTDRDIIPSEIHGDERSLTNTFLWDSRFFISISGEKGVVTSTVLRPYDITDVPAVMFALKKKKLDQEFRRMMSAIAPDHIRHTLPVLVVAGEIVAFPTLDFRVVPSSIDWEVRYTRDERSTEFFFPGIKRGAVISWEFVQSTTTKVTIPRARKKKVHKIIEEEVDL